MPTIGATDLLSRFGSHDKVAEAWIKGELNSLDQRYAPEVVNKTDLEAARIRIEMQDRGKVIMLRGFLEDIVYKELDLKDVVIQAKALLEKTK